MIDAKKGGIIILEGPDAQGKTTLAQTLARLFSSEDPLVLHCTYRFGHIMWQYHTAVLKRAVQASNDRLVIIDRHWPSEICYGQTYRQLNPRDYIWEPMDLVFQKHGALHIMCLSNREEAMARHAKNKDPNHPYDDSSFRAVWAYYAEVLAFMSGRRDWIHYQMEVQGLDVRAFCIQMRHKMMTLRLRQSPYMLEVDYPDVIGCLDTAKFLLVGEKRNQNKHHKGVYWPFYDHTDSSRFLFQALKPMNPGEYAVTNAFSDNDAEHHPRLFEISRQIPTVALGQKAQILLKSLGVEPTVSLPHPQWARRFDHHGTWGDTLKEKLNGLRHHQ